MVALSRGVSAPLLAEVAKPNFNPVILLYLDWPDAVVRVHSGVGTIVWQGYNWLGIGNFGSMQLPEEAIALASQSATLHLYGAGSELDDYIDDDIRNRPAVMWFGCVTERAGNVLVGEPTEIFSGYMDAFRDVEELDTEDSTTRSVVLSVAPGPSQRLAAEVNHTYEDQIEAFPGDTAGRFAINAEAEAKKITWPQ